MDDQLTLLTRRLMSELVLALIFGSLAGVMSSVMIMMGAGQQVDKAQT
jgi:preprotein translocase subunit SecF